jgi:threonine dehydratase
MRTRRFLLRLIAVVSLKDVQAAQSRIARYVRRTPLFEARPVRQPIVDQASLYLKLENMQITGSFKARGAVNKSLCLTPDQLSRGLITASGGNHGLGVAYAGWLAKVPVTVYLSANVPPIKAEKLRYWNAEAAYAGQVWDDANNAALKAAEAEQRTYVHPFADADVIAGQGTISLEILEDLPDVDVVLVAIGGGGLISGVSLALKALKPSIKVIGIEPVGAPTLYSSIKANHLVELESIQTSANTLAPRLSAEINLDIIRQNVDDIVLVTDEEMQQSARWLWTEFGIAAELSGAAALAALSSGKVKFTQNEKVCVLVCGLGSDGMTS